MRVAATMTNRRKPIWIVTVLLQLKISFLSWSLSVPATAACSLVTANKQALLDLL